jgi:hypothetical protein
MGGKVAGPSRGTARGRGRGKSRGRGGGHRARAAGPSRYFDNDERPESAIDDIKNNQESSDESNEGM